MDFDQNLFSIGRRRKKKKIKKFPFGSFLKSWKVHEFLKTSSRVSSAVFCLKVSDKLWVKDAEINWGKIHHESFDNLKKLENLLNKTAKTEEIGANKFKWFESGNYKEQRHFCCAR
mgnify:CR=1 FL=1